MVSIEGTWNLIVRKSMEVRGRNLGNSLLSSIVRRTMGLFDWSARVAAGTLLSLSHIQLRVILCSLFDGFGARQMIPESRASNCNPCSLARCDLLDYHVPYKQKGLLT